MTTTTHTFTEVPADTVRVGDRYHSLGRGYLGRDVTNVRTLCNCEGSARRLDPTTYEPVHEPVIEIVSGPAAHPMRSYYPPAALVTVSDGAY